MANDSNLKMEQETQKRLDAVFGDEPSTPSAISTPESSITNSAVSSLDESAVSTASAAESSAGSAAQSSLAESVMSTQVAEKKLSDAYYRAAVHQGWKPGEIKEFFEKDPDLAERTFAKLYESTNKLSQEFAAIGKAKQKPKDKPESKVKLETDLPAIDLEKLRREYEGDPIVDVIEQLEKQNKLLYNTVQKNRAESGDVVDEKELRLKIQEEEFVGRQIESFFGNTDLKGYSDFYGAPGKSDTDWRHLTNEQQDKRWNVVQMADQILIGAESQGRKMTIDEALKLAHLSVSEEVREKVIRADLLAKVTKRSKGLTLKPGNKTTQTDKKPQTRTELEQKVAKGLARLYG